MNTCGNCKHWNFKVSGDSDKSFGLCANPKVQAVQYISLRLVNSALELSLSAQDAIANFARVYYEESFGCIHWESESEL